MQAYLFVHFREKTTPDGEQVYFGLSRDGYHWEPVNGGAPVLWAYYGDKGVRDFTIIRCKENGKFYIIATDLSLAYGMRNQYQMRGLYREGTGVKGDPGGAGDEPDADRSRYGYQPCDKGR